MTPLDRGQRSNMTPAKYLQAMISYIKLFSYFEPLGPMIMVILGLSDMMTPLCDIKDVTWQPFCFGNKTKITPRQAFPSMYILQKSDETSCNILSFRTS